MNIDPERFPEGARLVTIFSLFKQNLGCADVYIGACDEMHILSNIEKNLTELSSKPDLHKELIDAAENEAADILAKLSNSNEVLYVKVW